MKVPQPHIAPLFQQAMDLNRTGDVYTAVKIYKKLIKLAPTWAPPYQYLTAIYKYHNDWKAAFYYGQRAIENGANKEDTWRNYAIAATALKKWQIARSAWNQVGFQLKEATNAPDFDMGIIPIRLKYNHFHEIVWAKQIDPARAVIESIPDPRSDRNYGDLILIDYKVTGYRIVKRKKIPVYDELQLLRRSGTRTFLVTLFDSSPTEISLLDRLCLNENLGFDNWSHLTELQLNKNLSSLPEYYNEDLTLEVAAEQIPIAIATDSLEKVLQIMKIWRTISLKNYQVLGL